MDPDTADMYRSIQSPQEDPVTQAVRDHMMKLYVGQEGKLPSPVGDYGSGWKAFLLNSLGAMQGAKPAVPAMARISKTPDAYMTPAKQPTIPMMGYKPEEIANAYSARPDMETTPPRNPNFPYVGTDYDRYPTNDISSNQLSWEVAKAGMDKAMKGEPNMSMRAWSKSPIHEDLYRQYKNAYETPEMGGNERFIAANEDVAAAWRQAGTGSMTPMIRAYYQRELFDNEEQMKYEQAQLKSPHTSAEQTHQLLAKDNLRRSLVKMFPHFFKLPDWYK
jgi:hypothetical protein